MPQSNTIRVGVDSDGFVVQIDEEYYHFGRDIDEDEIGTVMAMLSHATDDTLTIEEMEDNY